MGNCLYNLAPICNKLFWSSRVLGLCGKVIFASRVMLMNFTVFFEVTFMLFGEAQNLQDVHRGYSKDSIFFEFLPT